jgi:hypothetical protein
VTGSRNRKIVGSRGFAAIWAKLDRPVVADAGRVIENVSQVSEMRELFPALQVRAQSW